MKNKNIGKEYILDSFPVPARDNIRISRSKIPHGEESEAAGITLEPIWKKSSVRAEGDFIFRRALAYIRKRIETSFSNRIFSEEIHAATPQGFALKVIGFILVFSIRCIQAASWVVNNAKTERTGR